MNFIFNKNQIKFILNFILNNRILKQIFKQKLIIHFNNNKIIFVNE